MYKPVASTNMSILLNCLSILVFVFLSWFTLFSSSSFASEDISKLKKVILQLKWKHQFQFAGYYVAKAKGYYTQESLMLKL